MNDADPTASPSPSDPLSRPGEIAGWPKLKVAYRTDPERIADLLPPGFVAGPNPNVYVNVYCAPVLGEPEYGISTRVEASFAGVPGLFTIGMGIDQEAAIFISQELNGQPKFPCSILFYRFGDEVEVRATHQGYTFFEYRGRPTGEVRAETEFGEENEWWIKSSRAIGGAEKQYDFPPHVVRVRTVSRVAREEVLDGDIVLRDSPWDPYTELLPMREQIGASLVTAEHRSRDVTNAGPLDPIAFWPYADTIGGSRWPGERGGPRRA